MVSITLSVPPETRKLMKQFPEMNWSGFVRNRIEEKVQSLRTRDALREQLKREQPIMDWSVKLQRAARRGRAEELKKKGLL